MTKFGLLRTIHVSAVTWKTKSESTVTSNASYDVPGVHEGRRPEGASNGGSKWSAECMPDARYVQIRQTTKILRPSGYYITTFWRAYVYMLRATGTQEIESERYCDRDVELFCSTPHVPWRQ